MSGRINSTEQVDDRLKASRNGKAVEFRQRQVTIFVFEVNRLLIGSQIETLSPKLFCFLV
jgi:hypothetical protein